MEAWLQEINSAVGVIGSFVCLKDGTLVARMMPESMDQESIQVATRIVSQTLSGLEGFGHPVSEADFLFDKGRLVIRNLDGGTLVILCTSSLNPAFLNLRLRGPLQKIANDLKQSQSTKEKTFSAAGTPPPPKSQPVVSATTVPPVAMNVPPAVPSPVGGVQPSQQVGDPVGSNPLFIELKQEVDRLHGMAKREMIALYAIDPVSFWERCPHSRRFLAPPSRRYLTFAATQGVAILHLFRQAGYQPGQRANYQDGSGRWSLYDAARNLAVDVYMDAFEMYQRVDFTELFDGDRRPWNEIIQEEFLPPTDLAFLRLQLVDMTDEGLKDLCALFAEYGLGQAFEEGTIDAFKIIKLCADDWGWYKTITTNLERLNQFVPSYLAATDQPIILERVRRLNQSIVDANKSLRWRARARLGTSAKWHLDPIPEILPS